MSRTAPLVPVLRAALAALDGSPLRRPRGPFNWAAYERLFAEFVAGLTLEQVEAGMQWYAAALRCKTAAQQRVRR